MGVVSVAERTTPPADRASRRSDGLALLVGATVVAVAHVAVALDAVAPVQTKDEIGYLAAARWFATGEGAGLLTPEHAGGYAVGWGLLTAPLWWLTTHPPTVYAASVAVVVLLSVLVLLPATAVARRAGLATPLAVLAGVVVCLGAGRLGYSGYALPESLLTLQLTAVLWLLLRLWSPAGTSRTSGGSGRSGRSGRSSSPAGVRAAARVPELVALTLLLAWLPTTHARMAPLALLAWLSVASWAWSRRSAAGAVAIAVAGVGAGAGWWLNGHVEAALYDDVTRLDVAAQQVDGLHLGDVAALAVGHAWYAGAAWLGLSLLGWWAGAGDARAELRARVLGPWTWLALGAVGQLAVGAAYLSGGIGVNGRVDQLVYGRYGDPVWFLLALVGVASLLARVRPTRLLVAAGASLVLLSLGSLVVVRAYADRVAGFVQLNVPGLQAWAWRRDDVFEVPWAPATVAAAAALGLLAVAVLASGPASRLRVAAVVCTGAALLGLALVAEARNIEPRDAWIRSLFGVRELVATQPGADVVLVVDRPLLLSGNALQWWLADREPDVVEPGPLPAPLPGTVLVAPSDEPPQVPDPATLQVLGTDATGTYAVWLVGP